MIQKILGLLVNTLTVDGKHSLLKRDNLKRLIQMQISKKQKVFFDFFSEFFKSRSSFAHFLKKDDPQNLYISELADRKGRAQIIP